MGIITNSWLFRTIKLNKIGLLFLFALLLSKSTYAHCPLCTAGAAIAAGGAAWLGVNNIVIGLFIGAFAVSMGWWISNLIKKQYIPYQKFLIILSSFLTTVLPLTAIINNIFPIYISVSEDYGSLLNRTYLINSFLLGSIIGGIIVSISPSISNLITRLRKGITIPFQGIIITLSLTIITGVVIQLIVK